MLKVVQENTESNVDATVHGGSLLDEIVRDGARQMLAAALQAEVAAYVERFAGEVDEHGHRLVVRNGSHAGREVLTAAGAVAVGMFCGLIPGPFQMLGAALCCVLFRVNLPLALFTTLYTNPLTYMPLYFLAYQIGARLLGTEAGAELVFPEWQNGHFFADAWHWLLGAGKPLLVGVPTLGALLAVAGYFIVLGLWRLNTARQWQRRKAGRE